MHALNVLNIQEAYQRAGLYRTDDHPGDLDRLRDQFLLGKQRVLRDVIFGKRDLVVIITEHALKRRDRLLQVIGIIDADLRLEALPVKDRSILYELLDLAVIRKRIAGLSLNDILLIIPDREHQKDYAKNHQK